MSSTKEKLQMIHVVVVATLLLICPIVSSGQVGAQRSIKIAGADAFNSGFVLGQQPGDSSFKHEIAQSAAPLTIDGKLNELFWQSAPALALNPGEAGVPVQLGGDIRVALRGTQLALAARCPEPGGKILARSIGRNPIWEKDSLGSSEVEDRLQYRFRYRGSGGVERDLSLTINPWGAYRFEQDGQTTPSADIQVAAAVDSKGWTFETVLPLELLDLDRKSDAPVMSLRVERIRSRRPLAPEFRWFWPSLGSYANLVLPTFASMLPKLDSPAYRPPLLGNGDPPLEVGRVLRVPSILPEWDDPKWRDVPAFPLGRNEPLPRPPRYPTEMKWMHDGRTLALLIHALEPEPIVARAGGRDSLVAQDDHVSIYLATSGSAFVEVVINSVGAVRDALGVGPHISQPDASWNAPIEVQTNIRYGAWTAGIHLPLLDCARALGEGAVPAQWRVLITRYRAPRRGEAAEVSAIPVVGSATFFGPARYRRLLLRDVGPAQVKLAGVSYQGPPRDGLAGELAALDSHVWSPLYRRYHAVRAMIEEQAEKRAEQAILAERQAWEKVKTREDWEQFRDFRLQALREAVGAYPPERPPLDVRVTSRYEGNGYARENLVYQSRAYFYVAANLYLPSRPRPRMPAIVIQHSYHYPKTQGELQDMGMIGARAGCAVLVIERLGFGERLETTPWFRQPKASWFTFSKQLNLIGETHEGWMAWDLIRGVDLLYERPDIDRDRVVLLGSVAGGDEPAALAAALDTRVAAVIPINYDRGHIQGEDEDLFGQISKQLTTSFIVASVAPRRYVRAFEFGWEGAEEPDFPDVWVSGWLRAQKVWGLYGALENLASSQGYGLIRLSMERISHCWSVGPQQRKELYPILQRWFDIPPPPERDVNMLPDSEISTNPNRQQARIEEAQRRRPEEELLSINPAVSAELQRKPLHQIAQELGLAQLQAARAKRAPLTAPERRLQLRKELTPILGDIEPPRSPQANTVWTRSLFGTQVEAIDLKVEEGIALPVLLIHPAQARHPPIVVAVAQAGKEIFLLERAKAIEELLRAGVAVCLPDLRGTGETSPDPDRSDHGTQQTLALREFSLGNTLFGSRLKDLRTVLAYLTGRSDIDARRIALWGDSFTSANPRELFLDEIQWEGGPQIQYRAEPLGAHLVLLTALYEDNVNVVAARGGLSGYISLLGSAFTYTPGDVVVPRILTVGDIADIGAAIAPRPLLMERCVDGRNVLLNSAELEQALEVVTKAYRQLGLADKLKMRSELPEADLPAWLIARLKL